MQRINDYKKEVTNIWLDRPVARKIARLIKGKGFITQMNEFSTTKVKEFDAFRIVIYAPEYREPINKLVKKDII